MRKAQHYTRALSGAGEEEAMALCEELGEELPEQSLEMAQVRNAIFVPFIYKNDHFAKTDSGQT